jgi:hypothetical protein
MNDKEYTPNDFYQIANKMGITQGQLQRLRSNRLFPLTNQIGLGRGKGKKYFYTEKSIDELKTLIYWRNQPQARNLKDLRWYLWLFGEWNWLWNDIKKDLLDLFPKPIKEINKSDEINSVNILGNIFSKNRYKLFKGSEINLWKLVAPNIIRQFLYKHITERSSIPLNKNKNNELVFYPKEINLLLGDDTYTVYEKLITNDLYSIFLLKKAIQECTDEVINKLRPQLQDIENAWNNDSELITLKRIMGIRPLRRYGLHRMYRVVSVSSFILINLKQ